MASKKGAMAIGVGDVPGKEVLTRASRGETVPRELRVPQTEEEKVETGEALALALELIDELTLARREVVAGFREKIEAERDKVTELGATVRLGAKAEVDCTTYLLPGNAILVVREDTGEVVVSRSATKDELQQDMFLGAPRAVLAAAIEKFDPDLR